MADNIKAVHRLDQGNQDTAVATKKTEVAQTEEKRLLEEVLGFFREEQHRKIAQQHQSQELLAIVQAEPRLVESAVKSATTGNPVVLCTAVYTHQALQLQALENSLEKQTTLAEEAASKQKALHNNVVGDAERALLSEREKTAAAVERADSHQAHSVTLAQELQALSSRLEEQTALAEQAASKMLVQKALHSCILGDAQRVLGLEMSKTAAAAVRADSHQAECATLTQELQEVVAEKGAKADGQWFSQKEHDAVIEKEKQAVEGARKTVKDALSRLKAAQTEITDLTEQLQAEKSSASQACAAATKEAELLSGKADRQLTVSGELQTDMKVLRKEKKKERKALRKQMGKMESKQQIAEMEASKLPMVQAGAVASLQQELAAAQQAAANATTVEKKVAAEAAHVKERFEVEAEKRNKALVKIVRLEAELVRMDQATANDGSNAAMAMFPHEIEDQQEVDVEEDSDSETDTDQEDRDMAAARTASLQSWGHRWGDPGASSSKEVQMVDEEESASGQEAKDIAAATAASLETGPPGVSSCKVCEFCGVAPHPVEECPLVKRVSIGFEETPQQKKEEGEWQQVKVKAAPGKGSKQPEGHKGKGNTQGQGRGKGKQAGQHGGKGQKGAGRVLTVPRGQPVARPANPPGPQEGPHPPSMPSATSHSRSPQDAQPDNRRGMTSAFPHGGLPAHQDFIYAKVMVWFPANPKSSGPAPHPRAGSR